MPAVGIAGATFTVEAGAVLYSEQVTTGTITTTSTIMRTRTLGPANAFTQTDLIGALTLTFLYDGASGLFDALQVACDAGTGLACEVAAGSTWTFAAGFVESVDTTFDAAGVATCTTSITGDLVVT